MAPVVPCSISSILLFPGTALAAGKANSSKKCYSSRKPSKHTLSYERFILPPSSSVSLFSRRGRNSLHHKVSASETDVAASESESPVEDASEIPANGEQGEESSGAPAPGSSPAPARQSGNPRKSAREPINNEDLILGATFTGEVRSIQPFGAFVDIGAFTDGLVHVSRLTDGFVKDVGSVVSVGQEVKVTLIEVDLEKRRIGLSMREGDDGSRPTQPRAASSSSAKSRTSRKGPPEKTSEFSEGENLVGTVKNLTRSGAFISLPGGGEGFLPKSEEGSTDGELEVGKEVKVQVLHFNRGRTTLTMKTETGEGSGGVILQTEVYVATNPFKMAFLKNEIIAKFLDEREKQKIAAKALVEPNISEEKDKVDQIITGSDTTQVQEPVVSIDVGIVNVPETVDETAEVEEASSNVPDDDTASNGDISEITASSPSLTTEKEEEVSSEILALEGTIADADSPKNDDDLESIVSSPSATVGDTELTIEKEEEVDSEILAPEGSISIIDQITVEYPPQDEVESDTKSESSEDTPAEVVASESPMAQVEETQTESVESKDEVDTQAPAAGNEVPAVAQVEEEPQTDSAEAKDEVDIQAHASGNEVPAVAPVEDEPQTDSAESKDEVDIQAPASGNEVPAVAPVEDEPQTDNAESKDEVDIQAPASGNEVPAVAPVEDEPQTDSAESKDEVDIQAPASGNEVPAVAPVEDEPQTDSAESKDEVDIQAPAAENEVPVAAPVEEELASLPEKDISVTSSDVQPAQETKASISPALVKQLREESGAGMMDCKNALLETEGDIAKAQEFLRKKGLASAEKKASRTTAEGRIGSYIHDGRIGVLVEVNCETDFVSRGDIFKELVEDLAMQVAACPQVQYVDTEDVPEEIVNKEKDIEMQKEDLLSKPEQMRSRIVEGRIKKMLGEMSLLEQPYIKNDKVVVKDWVKQTIATVGENMRVKRFLRFNLGEGLEKKSQDFAAEVAAQTAAKPVPAPEQEQPTPVEAKETVETRPPAVAVSAALVKQLRDETGAGMMDCKKALSETGGDLEKAQEYLRKKGLSSADKKSSRLAAEGRIGSYIHDSRIGVLIEVNCETDFVGRSEKFKELVDDLAMQVVANPLVQYVSIDDIPASIVLQEKEIEMQRDDLQSKPENIREKIVEGRVLKRMGALALLEQPFIKDDSVLVKDLVKQNVAAIGENIKVRRFVKFTLGET